MVKTIMPALQITAMTILLVGVAKPAAAAVTIYTDEAAFAAAVDAKVTEQFSAPENGYTGQGSSYSTANFTIASTGYIYTVDAGYDPLYQWNSGAVLDAESSILTISTSFNAVGFNFGNPQAANSDSNTVMINGVEYGGYSQPQFAFFGVTSTDGPVGPVTVNFNGGLGILDNVTTGNVVSGVPELSTWAMMLLGIGGLGFLAHRNTRRVSAMSMMAA